MRRNLANISLLIMLSLTLTAIVLGRGKGGVSSVWQLACYS